MGKEINIVYECCEIWNNLKDKSQIVNYLIDCKQQIFELEQKIQLYEKERLNCSQLESGMAKCIIQKEEIKQLKQQLEEKDKLLKCYQDEEKLIAKILGDESLTIIGSRVHLENLIVELKNKIRDRDLIIEEKNKQIEDWKQKTQTFLNRVSEQNYEIANNNPKQLAIQELEKVKQTLHKGYYEQVGKYYYAELGNIEKVIDNQIKKLKGE